MLLALACSSGTSHDEGRGCACNDGATNLAEDDGNTGDDALIVPEGLSVTALAGGNGVLDVIALTLRGGANGLELYAAVKNNGEIPACNAALSVELFDKAERSVAAGIGGLLTPHFYRRTDGSNTIAACVAPGEVTMAAVTELPSDIVVEEVATVVYRCPYFALDVVPIGGLTIGKVERVTGSAGAAYKGTVVNGLGVAVRNPSVTVFLINRVGRPLGATSGTGTVTIPPGGSWAFETDSVSASAADCVAYPAGALAN